MKQTIVLQVKMSCEKCRTKAMEIAATAYGVSSVAIGGFDKETLTIIGNNVDAAALTSCLRKKVGSSIIVSVTEEKPKPEKIEEKVKDEDTVHIPITWAAPHPIYYLPSYFS